MSVNKLISIYDSVNDAFEDMGVDISNDTPVFTRWAIKAEKKIGSYYGLKRKVFVLDVKNCIAHIPANARFVQIVVEGDKGCECDDLRQQCNLPTNIFGAPGSENHTFLVVDIPGGNSTGLYSKVRWEIQDNKIVFAHKMTCEKITIQALVYEVDCHGFPLVNENHIEALTNYIMYKYASRSRFSANKMDMGDVIRLKNEWIITKGEAIADDSELSETDRQDIVNMIHDPWIGYGLEVNY